MRWFRRLACILTILLAGPLLVAACGPVNLGGDWRTADRSSAGLAPDPAAHPEAVVQIYAARAFRWRGVFAVHTWIATKPRGAREYTIHEVLGWRARAGGSAVASYPGVPDRRWYGADPEVVAEIRGAEAQAMIPRIEAAVRDYPDAARYVIWPGPNSNTFVAHVAREVPGLGVDLPPTAIGKDFLADGRLFAPAPSNTGWQISLFGVLGLLVALEEGVEINVLSLSLGVDPLDLAVRLPGIGRVGLGS